jgi:hypothetical protein
MSMMDDDEIRGTSILVVFPLGDWTHLKVNDG